MGKPTSLLRGVRTEPLPDRPDGGRAVRLPRPRPARRAVPWIRRPVTSRSWSRRWSSCSKGDRSSWTPRWAPAATRRRSSKPASARWSASTATPRRWPSPRSGCAASVPGSARCRPGSRAWRTRCAAPGSSAPVACCSTSASPRCRSTAPSAASPTASMARSTCAWAPTGATAADVVNTYPEDELVRVLFEYGQERYARRIAAAIERARRREPIQTTAQLVGDRGRRRPAPSRRAAPRAAHLPGDSHRGQRRTRGARRLPSPGGESPRARRPDRGDLLPLAGGSDRQAISDRRRPGWRS